MLGYSAPWSQGQRQPKRRLWKDPAATLAYARAFLYAVSIMLLVRDWDALMIFGTDFYAD